jgi:hypothetical protein
MDMNSFVSKKRPLLTAHSPPDLKGWGTLLYPQTEMEIPRLVFRLRSSANLA